MGVRADSPEERTVEALRQRRQFDAAEQYCAERLADPRLTPVERAQWTIELSRALAEHALDVPPAQQPPLWDRARGVVDDFIAAHPPASRHVLVRVQGALAALAQAQTARDEAELTGSALPAPEAVRGMLRSAVAQLRKLDVEISSALDRSARPARPDGEMPLSTAQLASLQRNVRYELARGLRNQGLCYPAASADRYSALTQAMELLAPLAKANPGSSLAWNSGADEISCLRQLDEYELAEKKLLELEKAAPPPAISPRLRAERIYLALARGQIDEALSEAGQGPTRTRPQWAETSHAQLQAYLAGWQRALTQHDAKDAAAWEQKAVEQVRSIEKAHGPLWMRKAEALLARVISKSAATDNPESLVRAAQSFYRSGQLDEALAAYDRAARLSLDKRDKTAAFQAAYNAATIEKEREHFSIASDRYRNMSLAATQHPQAAESHLLAVYCAAQWAQRQQPPRLEAYEQLLAEHVRIWPHSPTASQAWWWLGRVKEHEGSWDKAIEALLNVKADHPQYGPAVEALGRAYLAQWAELRAKGRTNQKLAQLAVGHFEKVMKADPRLKSPAARSAALWAARISLAAVPRGAARAESILTSALRTAGDDTTWQGSLRSVLIPVLVHDNRLAEAEELLKQVPIGTTAESLAMVNTLAEYVEAAPADRKVRLAEIQLLAMGVLLARQSELDAPTFQKIERLQVSMLTVAGRPAEAIEMLRSMAKRSPRDGQTQEEWATLLTASRETTDWSAAFAKWREIIGKSRAGSPRWFRANLGLAQTQLKLGKSAPARATIKLVEASYPDFGGAETKSKFQHVLAECEASLAQQQK